MSTSTLFFLLSDFRLNSPLSSICETVTVKRILKSALAILENNFRIITSACENDGEDWEDNFPRFSLQSEDYLQYCGHNTDPSADEEIGQYIKLRHDNKNQD